VRIWTVLPLCTLLALATAAPTSAQTAHPPFTALDVFQVEYASDVQIAPDGQRVAYVRTAMSIMRDRREGRLWIVDADGSRHRKLTSADRSESSPRWSPDGTRIAFVSGGDDGVEIYVYWIETGSPPASRNSSGRRATSPGRTTAPRSRSPCSCRNRGRSWLRCHPNPPGPSGRTLHA